MLAGYDQDRRRVEFLDPMGEVIAHHPGREMQVILFTHTHASRPNLDEAWFRLLSRHALHSASIATAQRLRHAANRLIEAHSARAAPLALPTGGDAVAGGRRRTAVARPAR